MLSGSAGLGADAGAGLAGAGLGAGRADGFTGSFSMAPSRSESLMMRSLRRRGEDSAFFKQEGRLEAADAIVIGEVFAKKTAATPRWAIEVCRRRFLEYDDA